MTEPLNNAEIDALFAQIADVLDERGQEDCLRYVADRVGTLAESYPREYPDAVVMPLPLFYMLNGKPSKFKSEKQRAYVAIRGKKGLIPGKRTGQLGNSITHETTVAGGVAEISVGSNKVYAKYPLGDETQQNHYLAMRGWKSLRKQLDAHADDLRAEVVTTLDHYLDGALGGQ